MYEQLISHLSILQRDIINVSSRAKRGDLIAIAFREDCLVASSPQWQVRCPKYRCRVQIYGTHKALKKSKWSHYIAPNQANRGQANKQKPKQKKNRKKEKKEKKKWKQKQKSENRKKKFRKKASFLFVLIFF